MHFEKLKKEKLNYKSLFTHKRERIIKYAKTRFMVNALKIIL